jgi:hypothetical protein
LAYFAARSLTVKLAKKGREVRKAASPSATARFVVQRFGQPPSIRNPRSGIMFESNAAGNTLLT